MLRERVITAIVLVIALLLASTLSSPSVFSLILAAVVVVAAFEWSVFLGLSSLSHRLMYVGSIGLAIGVMFFFFESAQYDAVELRASRVTILLFFGLVYWLVAIRWIVKYPDSLSEWNSESKIALMGTLALLPAWAAVVQLKYLDPTGASIIALVALVASVDIGAYFAGSNFGKTKLAENVSPKKTWEGVWGGVAFCVLLSGLLVYLFDRYYASLGVIEASLLMLLGLTVAFFSVAGDLAESMLKRNCNVKDSGSILPGHGGILDRVDGMISSAPVFIIGLLFILGNKIIP
ncbi:MAG: phosphatidate cytidylyltransferase [Pseudohongiella sp.]|nr:MAG: phosphatidate cytidylyltransferase [Pseudohongiella sp.]